MRQSFKFPSRAGSKNDLVSFLEGYGLLPKIDFDYTATESQFNVIFLSDKCDDVDWKYAQMHWAL